MKSLVLVLILGACASPMAPMGFPGEKSLYAPVEYRIWYAELEACSGLKGNYDALVLRTAQKIEVAGETYSGYWERPHRITILVGMTYKKALVDHEFMHDLLQSPDHPAQFFNGNCGDLTVK